MSEWIWTIINPIELAEFVTPYRATKALGGHPRAPGETNHDLIDAHQYETILRAVYQRLAECRIEYNLEPFNYDANAQPIRTPEDVIGSDTHPGEGTCLDLSLLLAGICLDRRLRPFVVVFKQHALVLVSIVDSTDTANPEGRALFDNGPISDFEPLKQLVEDGFFVAVETTGFGVKPGAAGRNAAGQLDYDQACAIGRDVIDGTSPLGGASNFRFAIEPQQLFEAGVKPRDQIDPFDGLLEEFQRGNRDAGDAVSTIIDALPPDLQVAPSPGLNDLREALREVLKTYDIVHQATGSWLKIAHSTESDEVGDLVANLVGGDLIVQIEDQRGHCHKIDALYKGGARDFLRTLVADDEAFGRVDQAFMYLVGADGTFFDRGALVGEYITNAANDVSQAMLSGDDELAGRRLRESASNIAMLQRAVGANRSELKRLGLALFGSLDAVESGVSLPPELMP